MWLMPWSRTSCSARSASPLETSPSAAAPKITRLDWCPVAPKGARSIIGSGYAGPRRRDVRTSLLGDSRTHLHDRRVARELARDQRLAEPERAREVEQAGRDEGEDLVQVDEVGGRVHPHQD